MPFIPSLPSPYRWTSRRIDTIEEGCEAGSEIASKCLEEVKALVETENLGKDATSVCPQNRHMGTDLLVHVSMDGTKNKLQVQRKQFMLAKRKQFLTEWLEKKEIVQRRGPQSVEKFRGVTVSILCMWGGGWESGSGHSKRSRWLTITPGLAILSSRCHCFIKRGVRDFSGFRIQV